MKTIPKPDTPIQHQTTVFYFVGEQKNCKLILRHEFSFFYAIKKIIQRDYNNMKTEQPGSIQPQPASSRAETPVTADPVSRYRVWLARIVLFIFKSPQLANLFLPQQNTPPSEAGNGANMKRISDRSVANVMDDQAALVDGQAEPVDARAAPAAPMDGRAASVNARTVPVDGQTASKNAQATLSSEWHSLQRIQSPALYQTEPFLEIFYQEMLKGGSTEERSRTSSEKLKKLKKLEKQETEKTLRRARELGKEQEKLRELEDLKDRESLQDDMEQKRAVKPGEWEEKKLGRQLAKLEKLEQQEKQKKLDKLDTSFQDSRQEDGFADLKGKVLLRHLLHEQKNMDKESFAGRLMALPVSQKLIIRSILNNITTNALVHRSIHGHPRDLVSREQIELLELIESNEATCKEFIYSGVHPITESWASVQNKQFATISGCIKFRVREDIEKELLDIKWKHDLFSVNVAEIESLLSKKTLNAEEKEKLNKALPLLGYARQTLLDIRLSAVGRRWHDSMLQDPSSWPAEIPGYKLYSKLLEIDRLRSPEIDQAQLDYICAEHDKNGGKHRLSVAVEGAGPSGLLTAITQFHQGARVHVFEVRDTGYDRVQVVRLDPLWMHTLKFYLGEKYFSLFGDKEGKGRIYEDGFGEIVTSDLEEALHIRFSELNSLVSDDDKLSRLALYRLDDLEPPQRKGGKYTAKAIFDAQKNKHLPDKSIADNKETVEKEIDMLICAGGKNSTLTKKHFKRLDMINERDYGVTSWESNGKAKITNDSLDTFHDFRNMIVCDRDFLQKVNDRFNAEFKKIPVKNSEAIQSRQRFPEEIQGAAWEDIFKSVTGTVLQTRTFENKGLIYIGMEIPEKIAEFGNDIEKKLTEVDAAYAGEAKKIFQQAWFQAVGEYYGLERKGASDDTMKRDFTAMFPVSQHRLEENVVVEESADKAQVIITAVGDAKASPHFMRYSGLTGAREHILSLSKFTRGLSSNPDNSDALMEQLEQEDQRTADFVIDRGRIFLDADCPTTGTGL